jgi:putative toxin-antitoxin system antitoxin component (TIGR02293 family)
MESFDLWYWYQMRLVSAEDIASILHITPTPQSFAELDARVAAGLPKSALKASIAHVALAPIDRNRLLHSIIPPATYKRRRDRLSAEESGRAERLARVFATAQHVWHSEHDARTFLNTPHAMLEGQSPLDVSLTEIGARRVEDLLWQLFYGIPA